LKIAVIGAGVQGSTIALFLTRSPEVSQIVSADVSLDRAKQLAKKLKSDKISAMRVDAGNVDDLAQVMKGIDVVINATVPRFNLKIMDAALKSGVNYVDLAADVPVQTAVMKELELSPKWKDAGLTAVINQGGPFVMNVLVRYAADRLEKVDAIRLRFGWKYIANEPELIPTWEPRWSPEVALTEWAPEPVVFENGKFKQVPRFSGLEEYAFPSPVGPILLSLIEYEPVFTLPQFIGKGVKYVDCKITLDVSVAALINLGFADDRPIEVKGVKVAPKDVLLAMVRPPVETKDRIETGEIDAVACYLAEVIGESTGQKTTYTMYRTDRGSNVVKKYGAVWSDVAIPAVVTAAMLAKGEIKARGVIPPEGLEPKLFLAKLAEIGVTFQEKVTREVKP
jgi:saccharopine dehydrogenase-like NADP-dependent oxidoreductase